jgi:carbamoyltransferase
MKMAYGFPRNSIWQVIKVSGIDPADIQKVAVATENTYFSNEVTKWDGWLESKKDGSFRSLVFGAASNFGSLIGIVPGLEGLYYLVRRPIFMNRQDRIREILTKEYDISADVVFINHHFAHAASAYFTSGFKDAMVVSMDGGGDACSSHIYEVRNGKFKKVSEISAFDSLGNYYSYITTISGFKAQRHEGKITGLAAHGKPLFIDLLRNLIDYKDGTIKNHGKLVFKGAIRGIKKRLPAEYHMRDLASSIQMHSERLASEYIGYWFQKSGLQQIALAGGLFANVRINQRIHELPGVDKLFIHPGMDDGGLAVGAALAICHSKENEECIENVYYGPEYSTKEIEKAIGETNLEFSQENTIESKIASLLSEGFVVARFNSRMEYGPRALGNRSILYHPTDPSVNDWLNKNLKRTEFMPFAPSTLYEYTEKCYLNTSGAEESARFMTITFDCTDWMKKHCSGVVHVDGTARPQIVRKSDNESYYRIIDEFRKLTGLPTIINTSFNIHEEPIVCSPQDAIRAFLDSNLDYLALGNCLTKNPKPLTHKLQPVISV